MKYKCSFETIDCELGYQFGCYLHDVLKDKGIKKYCISIMLYGKEVYKYMSNECIIDNASWLKRKSNACLYFGMSTSELFEKNKGSDANIVSKYGLDARLYTFTPGSVPIVLANDQIVGSVTVSGMLPSEDHQSILDGYELFMNRNKE